jgi:hypothetical protein
MAPTQKTVGAPPHHPRSPTHFRYLFRTATHPLRHVSMEGSSPLPPAARLLPTFAAHCQDSQPHRRPATSMFLPSLAQRCRALHASDCPPMPPIAGVRLRPALAPVASACRKLRGLAHQGAHMPVRTKVSGTVPDTSGTAAIENSPSNSPNRQPCKARQFAHPAHRPVTRSHFFGFGQKLPNHRARPKTFRSSANSSRPGVFSTAPKAPAA